METTSDAWPRPIPVTERMPERTEESHYVGGDNQSTLVLAYSLGVGWQIAWIDEWGKWVPLEDNSTDGITNWLPLPPTPG